MLGRSTMCAVSSITLDRPRGDGCIGWLSAGEGCIVSILGVPTSTVLTNVLVDATTTKTASRVAVEHLTNLLTASWNTAGFVIRLGS